MNYEIAYEDVNPKFLLLQLVDDHDLEVIDSEVQMMKNRSEVEFVLITVKVNSWNKDLTPWPAEPVFGREPFGDGAPETLELLLQEILPELQEKYSRFGEPQEDIGKLPVIIGGYSLAGLFALWSGYESNDFYGVAAASPSVWYPEFDTYTTNHPIHAKRIYLSLGDKENRAKNLVMRTVADKITALHQHLEGELGADQSILEWNPGNHFVDSNLRMAKAFAWVMGNEEESP